jgi:dTDP-L-rhamnose 4-epimerase
VVKSVLVTGGAGFIGSHLSNALAAGGYRVRALDNFDHLAHGPGSVAILDREVELMRGDLRDRRHIERALVGVEAVLHLGGVVGNGESMMNICRAVESNSLATANLLEALIERRDRVSRVVAASSMAVYGEGAYACGRHGEVVASPRSLDQLRRGEWELRCPRCGEELTPMPISEDRPLAPTSVYGITKRDQEELVLTLGRAYAIEAVALRYLNVYGPGQALGNPYTGVAAIFAARLLSGRRPRVFEDGNQIRDLIHVSDVVRATIAALEAPRAPGSPINVATGRRVRVIDLARALEQLLAPGIEPEITGEFRAGDIRHCFADTARARALLEFEAERTLADALPELVEWVIAQEVEEVGDAAVAELRAAGLVG